MWNDFRGPSLVMLLLGGLLLGMLGKMVVQNHQQAQRYEKIDQLRSKSEYHDRILNTYLKCVRDDEQPEAICISNTIQLSDLNGYRDKIKEVFDDAQIPSH
jgi:hypothetical protein